MKKNYRPGLFSGGLKPGDRVKIMPPNPHLSHRKSFNGKVTAVDGAYILVRPMWCKWEAEYYPNELRKL